MTAQTMTTADFELFQRFLAFQKMSAAPDATAAIAATLAPRNGTTAVKTTTTSEPTTTDVTVTVATAGGYGITGTDGTLYSVGRVNRDARGKLFAGFKVGDTLLVTLTGKYVSAARLLIGSAPAAVTTVAAPRTVTMPVTTPAATVAAPAGRKNGTDKPACPLCQGTAHPHEGLAFLTCLSRQYTAETGLQVRMAPGYGAEFVAFAAWFAASERTAYAANTAGQKPYGGSTATPAVPTVWTNIESPVDRVMPNALQVPSLKTRDRCITCHKYVKAGDLYHPKCAPVNGATTANAAVVAAMSAETVHIDALDDDQEVVQETAVKAPEKRSQNDVHQMSGEFDVVLEAFKTDRDGAKKMDRPIIRFKSAEFITAKGEGRWLSVSREMYAKLDDNKYVGRHVRITLETGSRVVKIGRVPSETSVAVDTNPHLAISAAASRKAAVKRARTGHKAAPIKQTIVQTNAPTVATSCPKCQKRFSMVGKGQRGMCAECAPILAKSA